MVQTSPLRVILAKPRGFCAGVVRAVDIVEQALALYGPPVYVRHEIIHNKHVVADFTARGVIFIEDVDTVPEGALTVFSAHGVSRAVERTAHERNLDVIDATCPLVRRVHIEGRGYAARGYDVVMIGHAGHQEVEGTRGQIDGPVHVVGEVGQVAALSVRDPAKVAYVTQTTLSPRETRGIIDALTQRFPSIVGPDTRDICYASHNRQEAVLALARQAQLILVLGSANSSNSNRLREMGESAGVASKLIDSQAMLDPSWFDGVTSVGVTAGASAPEYLVQETIKRIANWRTVLVETLGDLEENIQFKMPQRLHEAAALAASGG